MPTLKNIAYFKTILHINLQRLLARLFIRITIFLSYTT